MTPTWPLTQQCTTLWSGVLFTKFGSHRVLLRQIDPWMTFDPRFSRFENMPTNLVGPSPTPMPTFSSIPDPGWPLPDLWPQQCIMLWSGIIDTKIGGHRAFLSKLTPTWPQLTATWPLTQQCITIWPGVLSAKFGGHRASLSNLTPTWPQLTPTWPLTPAMHYALGRDSSHKIWWP